MPCEAGRAERLTLVLKQVACLNNVSICQSEGSSSQCVRSPLFYFEYQSIANIAKFESKFKGIFDLTGL